MIPDKILEEAKRKSKLYKMSVHILKDGVNFFTVLDINIDVIQKSNYYVDKKVYHTILFCEK